MQKGFKLIFFCFLLIFNSYAICDEKKIVYLNLDYIVQNSKPGKLILQELNSKKKKTLKNLKKKKMNYLILNKIL